MFIVVKISQVSLGSGSRNTAWVRVGSKVATEEAELGDPIPGSSGLYPTPSLCSLTSWALDTFLPTSELFLLGPPVLPADCHAPSDIEIESSGVSVTLSWEHGWPPWSLSEDRTLLLCTMAHSSLTWSPPPFLPHLFLSPEQIMSSAVMMCTVDLPPCHPQCLLLSALLPGVERCALVFSRL